MHEVLGGGKRGEGGERKKIKRCLCVGDVGAANENKRKKTKKTKNSNGRMITTKDAG